MRNYLLLFLIFSFTDVSAQIGVLTVKNSKIASIETQRPEKKSGKAVADSIGNMDNHEITIIKRNWKYGMKSYSGEELIPVKFSKIRRIFNWYWMVEDGKKKGLYDIKNRKNLPTEFDDINFSFYVDAEFIVTKNGKSGIYNSDFKKVLPLVYDSIKTGPLIELIKNGKKSFLIKGQVTDKEILSVFETSGEGIYSDNAKRIYGFRENGKLGILDNHAKVLFPPQYDDIIFKRFYSKNKAVPKNLLLIKKDNKWGAIELSGKEVAPLIFDSFEAIPDYLIAGLDGRKYFFSLAERKLMKDFPFDRYVNLDKYSRVEKDGKETLIDNMTLKPLFPFVYDDIMSYRKLGYFSVKQNGKFGVIDKNQNIIIPLIYDDYLIFTCGKKAVAKKGDEYGIINDKNEVLLPFKPRYIEAYDDGFDIRNPETGQMEFYDCDFRKVERE